MTIPVTHITVMGEHPCLGAGCRYCADDDKHLLHIMSFVLESLGTPDGKLAQELLTKWKEEQQQ